MLTYVILCVLPSLYISLNMHGAWTVNLNLSVIASLGRLSFFLIQFINFVYFVLSSQTSFDLVTFLFGLNVFKHILAAILH